MKYLLLVILLAFPPIDPGKIARVNKAKKEAEQAYLSGNYQKARDLYLYLRDSLQVADDRLLLNLAHSHLLLEETDKALPIYEELTQSEDPKIRSIAWLQLGVINSRKDEKPKALEQFKNALRADPGNEEARHNYEVLKNRLKKEQEEQKQDNKQQNNEQQNNEQQNNEQNKDQQNPDQNENRQNPDQPNSKPENEQNRKSEQTEPENEQDREGQQEEQQQDNKQEEQQPGKKENQQSDKEQKEQQKQKEDKQEEQAGEQQQEPAMSGPDKEKLEQMNISEEKALQILNALKNREIEYIQQLRRKPAKKADPDKPDW